MRLGDRIKDILESGVMAAGYGVGQAYYTRPEAQAINPKENVYQGVVGGLGVLGALAGDYLHKPWMGELSEGLWIPAVANASANGTQAIRQKLVANNTSGTTTTTSYVAPAPQPQLQSGLGMDSTDLYSGSLG